MLKHNSYKDSISGMNLEIRCVSQLLYDNPLLNYPRLLYQTRERYGIQCLEDMIGLGGDLEVANEIVASINQFGDKHVVDVIFGSNRGSDNISTEINSIP